MERGGGGEIRQRMTLLDQLSLFQQQPSSNLRDLLKVRDEAGRDPRASPAVTLAAVLASDKNSPSAAGATAPSSPRTLLDVIRDEESRDAAAAAGSSSWRELTDRLRIRHAAAAASWTAGSASSAAESPTPAAATTTIRVSLMTLMELREGEEEERGGEEEPPAAVADVEVEEEEDDVAEEARRRDVCCVCMVRKKGAAFIPCGHTFCRLCSREMLAGRGNCPLCNAAIAEVLHIF
ncbi:arabinogalactan protein 1 [Iris pallida]|uniref:Arabinogalactan protein 1 n=1 Tax=Iris pallida TaxID=29817 RepID=A0AAX6H906_IRIPA|nr:arabinogalactan protein 1 [Iris pallida]